MVTTSALPDESIKVIFASIRLSGSPAPSLPAISIWNRRLVTGPVYSLRFMVSITISLFLMSPETTLKIVAVEFSSTEKRMSLEVTSAMEKRPELV